MWREIVYAMNCYRDRIQENRCDDECFYRGSFLPEKPFVAADICGTVHGDFFNKASPGFPQEV
jgi:hypothetical protein